MFSRATTLITQLRTMTLSSLILGMLTPAQFCALLGISDRTWRRWQADIDQVPAAVLLWLHIRRGHLDQYGDAWAGWHINLKTGELVSPAGLAVTPSQIEHMGLAWQERDCLRADNRALRKKLDKQKTPAAIPADGAKVIPFPR